MDENKIRQIIKEEIQSASQVAQYSVSRVPTHSHNNIDSPQLRPLSIKGFNSLDGTPSGVANPDLLNGQALVLGDVSVSTPYSQFNSNIYTYPFPIVYGYGTTSFETMTGTPSSGATSATLTGNWAGTTGQYAVQFDSTEIRIATLTNGSTAVTWTPALKTGAGGTNLEIINNARFHGGEAPYGTAIIFRNDDDGVLQLWVRTQPGVLTVSWAGVELGGAGLFIYT